MDWEALDHNTVRTKVPGGWLYKVTNVFPLIDPRSGELLDRYGYVTESIAFVPEVKNRWRWRSWIQ